MEDYYVKFFYSSKLNERIKEFYIFLRISVAAMPMAIPDMMPLNNRTGKYKNILKSSIRAAATSSCPKLCKTPPAMLTPTMLKSLLLLRKSMQAKLTNAPASEYSMPNKPLNNRPASTILRMLTQAASFQPNLYNAIMVTIFAIPSFMPGIAGLYGIIASM